MSVRSRTGLANVPLWDTNEYLAPQTEIAIAIWQTTYPMPGVRRGWASARTGITSLRHEKVSVCDDINAATMAVVTRVELDQGAFSEIVVVPKQDVQCAK